MKGVAVKKADVVPLLRGRMGGKSGRMSTVATSAKVREAVNKRRIDMPVIVTGVGPRRPITVTRALYHKIDVDPSYQRDVVSSEVNELIVALSHGGTIADPVTLVSRKWDDDGKWWVVDGLQRATALMHLDKTFEADLHEVDSITAERQLFLSFNSRQTVTPNRIVKSWPGPGAAMMRSVDEIPDHPLFGRIQWTGGGEKIAASIIAKGLVAATSGTVSAGEIRNTLSRLDYALSEPGGKARAQAFLRLVAAVFPKSYAPLLPVMSLGIVAHERWAESADIPPLTVLSRLQRINWAAIAPSYAQKFRPLIVDKIKSTWK